jgi:hypothetical protein
MEEPRRVIDRGNLDIYTKKKFGDVVVVVWNKIRQKN